MKSNIKESPLKVYRQIPSDWKINQVRYNELDSTIHYKDGWRDYQNPVIESTQKVGELIYDEVNDIVTKEVIEKTQEEIDNENKVYVPFSITKLQAMLMLGRMGIKDAVLNVVENSDNPEVKDYFEYAATWERASPIINQFAPAIGMSQTDLDSFFIEAEKVN